jgi:hypothetical protein
LTRLGLPFPLGGTSNHFRADALRAVGGWDAWNVTEDADLGFRLWRRGWRLGVLSRPTWETPPGALELWLPQRTRWLKGYMQTWGVHTRTLNGLGVRGAVPDPDARRRPGLGGDPCRDPGLGHDGGAGRGRRRPVARDTRSSPSAS